MKKYFCLAVCFLLILSGCATTGNVGVLDGGGKKSKKFKQLSDEEALKTVVTMYNVVTEAGDDQVAKSIALDVYLQELMKRKSAYIASSGVFELSYEHQALDKWTDREIAEMYKTLECKVQVYETTKPEELNEDGKALRLIRITAMDAVYKEGTKRDIFRNAMDVAMNALMIAANIALAMI